MSGAVDITRPDPRSSDTAAYEFMSPSLLARQPAALPERTYAPDEDWDSLYSHLESRLGMMRSWRWSWWAFWAVLAAFFLPFRDLWLVTANRMTRGGNQNNQIVDSTGLQAVRTCASGMWTLCSPSRPWFKIAQAFPWVDLDPDAKEWFKDTEDKLYVALAGSNFYETMAQAFRDVVVFGTAVPIMYEDAERIFHFYLPCAGEYYLANGGKFDADTLYREFTMTVIEIVDFFGLKNCPGQVATLWETGGGSLQFEFIVAHAIEPNFAVSARGGKRGKRINIVPTTCPFREIYWLKGIKTDRPLVKRGFHKPPHAPIRWQTVSNDAYGRSPCMDAIGDNKQVQTETVRKAEFIEKGVRPPMGADVELMNQPASTLPGMTTFMNTAGGAQNKKYWPLFEVAPAWLAGITADIELVNKRIQSCLYVDVFLAITRMEGVQPRNELELTKRDLERLQELGPVINLAEKALRLMLERGADILAKRRLLKPLPASLADVPLHFEFVSILRLAQRSAESVAIKDVLTTGGEVSGIAKNAGVPDPIRVVNLDKTFRHYADINNLGPSFMFTEDQVKEHDQARAKAQQQAQQPGQAMAAVNAAKSLSETQLPGGNSALGAMLGQQGS